MLLVIIRHAEASPLVVSDELRPLTDRGQTDAGILGQLLSRMEARLDAVEYSPLLRARQTASAIAGAQPGSALEKNKALAPGIDVEELVAEIRHSSHTGLALVFHAPDVSLLASFLLKAPAANLGFAPGTAMGLEVQDRYAELLWQLSPSAYRPFF